MMNKVLYFCVLCAFLPACRMVTERDIEPKLETSDVVSVVAVQYVASAAWTYPKFTDLSHFMV